MRRINLHLSEGQVRWLQQESALTGLSVAELVRRAIDMYIQDTRDEVRPMPRSARKQK